MADVTLTYKGNTIAEMSASGNKTIQTAGKYCEADIGVEYVKPSGGTEAPYNDVNFYDYNGKIVYSYTKEEFLALDSLPANPSHQGLTAQGWNWTFSGAKTYVNKYGILDIGQTYITDDGATRVIVENMTDTEQLFKLYWTQDKANGVTVDWGDGSPTETASGSGTSIVSLQHTYTGKGIFTISLMPDNDCLFWLGNKGNYAIWGAGNSNYNWAYKIKAVHIGKNYTQLGEGPVFNSLNNCEKITFPKSLLLFNSKMVSTYNKIAIILPYGVTGISVSSFINKTGHAIISLPETLQNITEKNFASGVRCKRICLPDMLSYIQNNFFESNDILQQVTIPDGITSIGNSAFSYCYALNEITIPSGVTFIGDTAFQFFRGNKINMLPTTPPTLSNANAFGQTNCTIYVPYSADHSILEAYKTATNWSSIASKIQEMSE